MALVGDAAVRGRGFSTRRGLSYVELLVVIVVLVLLCGLLWPWLSSHHRQQAVLRDAAQLRRIQEAMVVFANGARGKYPLPSLLDESNFTIPQNSAGPRSKDTTANILSILIWNQSITPDQCVSPAEVNQAIAVMEGYSFERPQRACDPGRALWDPSFSADFTSAAGGNTSYATIQTSDGRMKKWGSTQSSTEAVIGNRGPAVASVERSAETGRARVLVANRATYTFAIHGGRSSWEGNIAYNDGHVNFEPRLDPEHVTYVATNGYSYTDVLFHDEPDDPAGGNNFLGVWIRGGAKPHQFQGVWD